MRITYNDRGCVTSAAHYDITGRLCENKNGYAVMCITYNEQGVPISRTYYDAEGKLIAEE